MLSGVPLNFVDPGDDNLFVTTHRGEQVAGYAAEYCVICRDATEHAMTTRHGVDGISNAATCAQCGLRTEADISRYKSLHAAPGLPMQQLIVLTHPTLPVSAYNRCEFDHALSAGITTPEVRSNAIREPFHIASYLLNPAGSHYQPWIWGAALGLIVGAFALVWAKDRSVRLGQSTGLDASTLTLIAFGVPVATGAMLGHHFYRRSRRNRHSHAVEMIARSLRAIRPKAEELEEAVRMLGLQGTVPASMTSRRIEQAISRLADRSLSNLTIDEARAHHAAYAMRNEQLQEHFARTGETRPPDVDGPWQ